MNPIVAVCVAVVVIAGQVSGRPQTAQGAFNQVQGFNTLPVTKTDGNTTLVKNEVSPLDGKGAYSYDIELSDGTKLIQSGHTEAPAQGETEPSLVIQGSYAYVAPDGKQIQITYVADKNGFQPKGDAIPTALPAIASQPGQVRSSVGQTQFAPVAAQQQQVPVAAPAAVSVDAPVQPVQQ